MARTARVDLLIQTICNSSYCIEPTQVVRMRSKVLRYPSFIIHRLRQVVEAIPFWDREIFWPISLNGFDLKSFGISILSIVLFSFTSMASDYGLRICIVINLFNNDRIRYSVTCFTSFAQLICNPCNWYRRYVL